MIATLNPGQEKNAILKLTFQFAIDMVEYTERLEALRKYVIARQLLRSGTSIGANVNEAQASESLKDFIHKLKVSLKEANETEYWLLICDQSKSYPSPDGALLQIVAIRKILSKILKTSKEKLKNQKASRKM